MVAFFGIFTSASAFGLQTSPPRDSIVILLGKKTRIAIQTEDKADLQALKNYDLNSLVTRVVEVREKTAQNNGRDTSFVLNGDTVLVRDNQVTIKEDGRKGTTFSIRIGGRDGETRIEGDVDTDNDNNDQPRQEPKVRKMKRTTSEFYFDLGLNNYLTGDGQFPDQTLPYSLRPLGSRYVAISKIYKTRIGGARSPLYITYGLEASFYNFMFDGNNRIMRGSEQVEFMPVLDGNQNVRALDKTKLTAIYASLPVMPMFQFGKSSNGFRFGIGGFIGYRLHSYSKIRFDENRDKEHQRSNYYLNPVRYGVQALIGVRGIDLFFKYDLNPLFANDRGPDLRAIAFGIRF